MEFSRGKNNRGLKKMEINFMRFLEQGVSQKALKKMYDPLIRSVLFWYMEELLRLLGHC